MWVDPTTGAAHTFIANLNMAIDVACPSQGPLFLVLEFMDLTATPPLGRLLTYHGPTPTVLLPNITTPTSLALDESTGTAYIVSRSDGKILTIKYL